MADFIYSTTKVFDIKCNGNFTGVRIERRGTSEAIEFETEQEFLELM